MIDETIPKQVNLTKKDLKELIYQDLQLMCVNISLPNEDLIHHQCISDHKNVCYE